MKTINASINLYPFAELSEAAKYRAIQDHREFKLSIMQPSDFISGDAEYDTEEELQKTYAAIEEDTNGIRFKQGPRGTRPDADSCCPGLYQFDHAGIAGA